MEVTDFGPEQYGIAFAEASVARSPAVQSIINAIQEMNPQDYNRAIHAAAHVMRQECAPHIGEIPDNLFRAYDGLDTIFGFDYANEKNVKQCPERIYAGSGAGVQSSYANLVCVLEKLGAQPAATLVDLGSGYGRVCLFMALLRHDMQFIGYEYVESRVESANLAARRAGVDDRVKFHTQNLTEPNFVIPDVEFYYLYDPFTPETYQLVLEKLIAIGSRKKIALITKGNAELWVSEKLLNSSWTRERFDLGNMNIYWS